MLENTRIHKQIIVHFLIWISFITIIIIQLYWQRSEVPLRFFISMSINFVLFYLNYLFLVPQFLLKKKTILYIFSALLLVFISLFIARLFHFEHNGINAVIKRRKSLRFFEYGIPVLFNLGFLIIGTSIRVYQEWNRNEKMQSEIKSQKVTSELQYLKTQLNPHFLFNTLNSIYSLTVKKSNDAPEAVVTLSELMRYMLYQTNSKYVLLENELAYIENYMKLQRLRIANNENVFINIYGTVSIQKIKPLLLISFIENAFKYGTDFKGNTEVKIEIFVKENELQLNCVNLIGSRREKRDENSGIGLKNTKHRLQLLYPKKHWLVVKEENDRFIIDLKLKLD